MTGLKQLQEHDDLFKDLTIRESIKTKFTVISAIISYDSKLTIAILRDCHERCYVKAYSLTDYHEVFSVVFEGEVINMNLVEQNDEGSIFNIAYQDNGRFFVRVIDNTGKIIDDLNVSD